MFLVEQYYLYENNVNLHIYSINETLKESYNDLIDLYKMLPEKYIIFPNIPNKAKKEFIKYILNRNKDKCIFTIVDTTKLD